jgi:DNA polymerase III alpha subunit (gram-positive type)
MTNNKYFEKYMEVGVSFPEALKDQSFMVFDLETTGLDGDHAQVTQVAGAIVNGTTFEVSSEFYRRIRLTDRAGKFPNNVLRLNEEVASHREQGTDSIHWVLTYNKHHPLFRFQDEILKDDLDAGKITQEEYTRLLPATQGTMQNGTWPDGNPRMKKFSLPRVLTRDQLEEFLDDDADNGVEEEVALSDFYLWMEEQGVTKAAGHNAHIFDKKFITKRAGMYDLMGFWIPVTDTMWISRLIFLPALRAMAESGDAEATFIITKLNVWKNIDRLSSSLQDLREAFGVEGGEAHNAQGDVRTNILVLKAMVEKMQAWNIQLIPGGAAHDRYVQLANEAFAANQKKGFGY